MDKSFLVLSGYKLNNTEYLKVIDQLSELIPSVTENSLTIQERFLTLYSSDLSEESISLLCLCCFYRRENHSYILPSKREVELLNSYAKIIVRLGGR